MVHTDHRRVADKQRRQRAWVRVILRRILPSILQAAELRLFQARAAWKRWQAARLESRNLRRMKAWVAKQRVDPNAPCPACGAREGEIRFAPQYGQIIHRCKVCTALWPEKPIVQWDAWKVEIGEDQMVPEPIAMIEAWKKAQMTPPPVPAPAQPANVRAVTTMKQ